MTVEVGDKVICIWDGEAWEVVKGYVPEVGDKVLCRYIDSEPSYGVMGIGSFSVGDLVRIFPGGLGAEFGFDFPPFTMPDIDIDFPPFSESQHWGDSDFQSSSVQYFNGGAALEAGNYRLTVVGWHTIWNHYEERYSCEDIGYPKFYTCCMSHVKLITSGGETPLNDITVNRDLSLKKGWGNVYIQSGAVGLRMDDSVHIDNHGSTTFILERVG